MHMITPDQTPVLLEDTTTDGATRPIPIAAVAGVWQQYQSIEKGDSSSFSCQQWKKIDCVVSLRSYLCACA